MRYATANDVHVLKLCTVVDVRNITFVMVVYVYLY